MQAVPQGMAFQPCPKPLHGVRFRRVWGEQDYLYVFRDIQARRPVPAPSMTRRHRRPPRAFPGSPRKRFIIPVFTRGRKSVTSSPVAGQTALWAWKLPQPGRTWTMGRTPFFAQSRPVTGFRPKRASSKKNTGESRRLPDLAFGFFKVRLRLPVRPAVPRPGRFLRPAILAEPCPYCCGAQRYAVLFGYGRPPSPLATAHRHTVSAATPMTPATRATALTNKREREKEAMTLATRATGCLAVAAMALSFIATLWPGSVPKSAGARAPAPPKNRFWSAHVTPVEHKVTYLYCKINRNWYHTHFTTTDGVQKQGVFCYK